MYVIGVVSLLPPFSHWRRAKKDPSQSRRVWWKRFSVSVVVQTETVFSFLQGWQRASEMVFSFRRCTDRKRFSIYGEFGREQRKRFSVSERSFIPLDLDECGGNGFQFPLLHRRKQFFVSCKVGRERRKRFSVSVVVQTGNVFQFPASLAENRGNSFQFPKDLLNI